MSASETGKTLKDLVDMSFADQAMYFLNCFWSEFESKAAEILGHFKKFKELDSDNNGKQLSEFAALQFFEAIGQQKSRDELRTILKEKVDVTNDGKLGFIEFLCFQYEKSVSDLLDAVPGTPNQDYYDAKKALAEIKEKFKVREDAIKKLEDTVAAGGVKAASAKVELETKKQEAVPQEEKSALIKAEAAWQKAEAAGPVADTPATKWWAAESAK